jgi:hypothetical protein
MRGFGQLGWIISLSFLGYSTAALAQYPPIVNTLPAGSHGAVPAGFKQLCIPNPNTGAPSPTCPVLLMNGYTYWAYSQNDNTSTMAIVAYDATGAAAQQWNKDGARYLYQITVDPVAQTVAFVGQGNATITASWSELNLGPAPPIELLIAEATAQQVNCVFAANCQTTPTDTTGSIPLPIGGSGSATLTTRTLTGAAGSPAAGKTAYAYSVDLSQAAASGEDPCVTDLTLDFGPISKLNYDGAGQPEDAFVISQGGPGTIGLFQATRTANSVTFTFNQPVCAGSRAGTGATSYFVGLSSASAPKSVNASVGWPGLDALSVPARAPAY